MNWERMRYTDAVTVNTAFPDFEQSTVWCRDVADPVVTSRGDVTAVGVNGAPASRGAPPPAG